MYFFYRIAYLVSNALPLGLSYGLACALASIHYAVAKKDKEAVKSNLNVILKNSVGADELDRMALEVFKSFAKYLVDFFRFKKVDAAYIDRYVKVDGIEHIDKALARGKGVIILSAHLGNWELGGLVMSLLRPPMSAVVLTHQNRKINDFFKSQRMLGKMRPIEVGTALRGCYRALRENHILALLGDRDFSRNGVYTEFFGHSTLMPKGPAFFSNKLGSAIVPVFMIREPDDTFRLIVDEPIYPEGGGDEDAAITQLTKRCTEIIENYIGRYPLQWHIFRKMWNGDKEDMRPDSVV